MTTSRTACRSILAACSLLFGAACDRQVADVSADRVRPGAHAAATRTDASGSSASEASEADVKQICSKCHLYPGPETFPRSVWRREVQQAYRFIREAKTPQPYPAEESVVRYYESRAPEAFPVAPSAPETTRPPVRWTPEPVACPELPAERVATITSVQAVKWSDDRRELLVCDADSGHVLLYRPGATPAWRSIARLLAPATGCIVDLDRDGVSDVVVADLGRMAPGDQTMGKVVWLKGLPDGRFQAIVLASGLGRTADVQAADFRGTGRTDLVVAVYGWRAVGELLLLENHVDDWSAPKFVPRTLDKRHGAIHAPVADLNADGRPDFVTLFAQEHEQVVAFLNEGDGRFRQELIYQAPHPGFGCSGIHLADLNADGATDVVLTNGDTLDGPPPIRPYSGVRWLENRGGFPFVDRLLTELPGAMRAVTADVDRDGDLDVVAVSFLPAEYVEPDRRERMDSIVLLEQQPGAKFVRHVVERGRPDYVSVAAGDWRGDGRIGLATGRFSLPRATGANDGATPPIVLWDSPPAQAAR